MVGILQCVRSSKKIPDSPAQVGLPKQQGEVPEAA